MTTDQQSLLKHWRKRLARRLRDYRRAYGTWPSDDIIHAAKRGIADAVCKRIKPPQIH